jgi:hypothetical protein
MQDKEQSKNEAAGLKLRQCVLAFLLITLLSSTGFLSRVPAREARAREAQTGTTQSEQNWSFTVPKPPSCELQSNLTVDLSWATVPGADSYVVYWSQQRNFDKKKTSSTTSRAAFFNHKERQTENRNKLPMYYRIAAVKDRVESQPSEACLAQLFSSNGGKVCQIDGKEPSVGMCHLRNAHVCSGHNVFTADQGGRYRCP